MELRDQNGLTEAEFLAAYRPGDWPHPSVTADILVFARDKGVLHLLLIRRGGHPCLGKWALPGGFSEPGETLEQTGARELEEETHLTGLPLVPVGFFSDPGRDPRCWSMTQAFMTLVDGSIPDARADDDAQDTGWFAVQATKDGNTMDITLSNGPETLHAKLHVTEERTVAGTVRTLQQLEQEGLAFDHGKIIAAALALLNEQLPVIQA